MSKELYAAVEGLEPGQTFSQVATNAPKTSWDYHSGSSFSPTDNPLRSVSQDDDGRLVIAHPGLRH
ncbi:MAG: hypothetical protein H6860_04180 [Rhodospirillales bacterium]|nr:hypothetical protein [Alphaproteobacteria bacterium]MCB9981578.1 hypothetical protein [Rhodospirillales bacterium]